MKIVRNFIFQGGSVKGIAYLGALDILEKNGIKLINIEKIGGTSVGAITAALLSVGFSCKNLSEICLKMDFNSFLDVDDRIKKNLYYKFALNRFHGKNSFEEAEFIFGTIDKYRERAQEISGKWSKLFYIMNAYFDKDLGMIKNHMLDMCNYLDENKGLADGKELRKWIDEQIQSQTGIKDLTFRELKELHEKNKEKYKLLSLIGTNLNERKSEVFSYEETPDLIISDAVRISMSLPIVFKPYQQYEKREGKRSLADKKDFYIDGGVMDNYPIWLFDGPNNTNKKNEINSETLGFRLLPLKELLEYEKDNNFSNIFKTRNEMQMKEDNLFYYLVDLIQCFYNKQESDFNLQKDVHVERTIMIDDHKISTFKFNLNDEEKQNLITAGQNSAIKYINNYNVNKRVDNYSNGIALCGISVIIGGIITSWYFN